MNYTNILPKLSTRVAWRWIVVGALLAGTLATFNSNRAVVPQAEAAAVDYFLKLEGVEGESTAVGHEKEIQIGSFDWGEKGIGIGQALPAVQGGTGAGKVTLNDFHFQMSTNKATPILMQACATGKHFPTAVLTARKAGGNQQDYLIVTIKDVVVTSYSLGGGSETSLPEDQLALSFNSVEFEYKQQKDDGSLGESVKGSYTR